MLLQETHIEFQPQFDCYSGPDSWAVFGVGTVAVLSILAAWRGIKARRESIHWRKLRWMYPLIQTLILAALLYFDPVENLVFLFASAILLLNPGGVVLLGPLSILIEADSKLPVIATWALGAWLTIRAVESRIRRDPALLSLGLARRDSPDEPPQ